jgi:hypothetical protein
MHGMNNIKFAGRYVSFKNFPPVLTTSWSCKEKHFRLLTLQFSTYWTEIFHENGLVEAVLSLGHLVPLTLYHLIYSSGDT